MLWLVTARTYNHELASLVQLEKKQSWWLVGYKSSKLLMHVGLAGKVCKV